MKLLARLAVAMTLAGCGGAQQRGPQPKPNALMDRPAYQEGLADVLRALPSDLSQYGVDWVRYTYDLGYHVGHLERMQDTEQHRRMLVGKGCLSALDAFPNPGQEQAEQDVVKCMDLTRDALKVRGGSRGPQYSKAKLVVAEKGVEAGDARMAELLNGAFEVGYGKGFFAGAKPDAFEAAKMGCLIVAERRRVSDGAVKCSEVGLALQKEYLDQFGQFSDAR